MTIKHLDVPSDRLRQHTDYLHIYHSSGNTGRLDLCIKCGDSSEKYWGFTDLQERIDDFVEKHKICQTKKEI